MAKAYGVSGASKTIAGVLAAYEALVAAGELSADDDQRHAAARLDRLARELADYPAVPSATTHVRRWRLAALFNWSGKDATPPRGVYLWGGVGRGKSMLMDLFFDHAPLKAKKRVHFHAFMQDIHEALHRFRNMTGAEKVAFGAAAGSDDPIPPVARNIALEASLLCFDELQVTDVADAGILGRLFQALLERGVVVVATSNRPPNDLYKDGLNRSIILPFIALIERAWDILPLNGPTDYRMQRLAGLETYYVPNGAAATARMREVFFRLTDHSVDDAHTVPSETLTVKGRELFVPKALRGAAVFSFKRLCVNPLGAADYLAIARRYHTLFLVGVPQMGPAQRNEAKRFVTLIDTLYEHKVKLFMTADAEPQALYPEGDGAFEFARTVSRLMEMQSAEYMALGHGGG